MYRHVQLLKVGLNTSSLWVSRLINQISSTGTLSSLSDAHQLFDAITHKDVVLWTSLISAYTRFNQAHEALKLFCGMIRRADPNSRPNHFTYSTVATAIGCSVTPESLHMGRTVHAHVVKLGFIPNAVVLETAVVDMYVKCGLMDCAYKLFDEMPSRNLVTWNAMVAGCIQNEMEIHGLELFYLMKDQELLVPDEFSVATVLIGCAYVKDLVLGTQVHGYAVISGFERNCSNSIGNMYFQCGEVPCAQKVLHGVEGDVILKLLKIRGYVINKIYNDALKLIASGNNFVEILSSDYTICVPILTACTKLSLPAVGKQVHGLLVILGISCVDSENVAIIGSALIDMYSKCSRVDEARKVFENWLLAPHISLWNSMIAGYIHNGLIDIARTFLDNMPEKNVVSWTTMITGYVHNGMPQEGLNLLNKMFSIEENPRVDGNCMTFVVGLEACSFLTDLARGKQIHAQLIRKLTNAHTNNVIVGTALVDMYCKSGSLSDAETTFGMMLEKNVIAWTSIITGHAIHGFGPQAIKHLQQMMDTGVAPNEVTFVSILTACSHCGLVDEGLHYFKVMKEKYKLVPKEDHYTCLIDMLGRVGRLEEAWSFMEEIDYGGISNGCFGDAIWAAMLGACHLHGKLELAKMVAKKMLENGKQVSTTQVTLSNVYAMERMWNEAYGVRRSWKRDNNDDREPGLSRIFTHP